MEEIESAALRDTLRQDAVHRATVFAGGQSVVVSGLTYRRLVQALEAPPAPFAPPPRPGHPAPTRQATPTRALQTCDDERPVRRERRADRPEDYARVLRPRDGASCSGVWDWQSLRLVSFCDPSACPRERRALPSRRPR